MKKLFPLILILCIVGAWSSIITKKINTPKQYEEYLLLANKAYEREYYYEALGYANDAESVEGMESVYEAEALERDCYYRLEEWDSFESQCKSMIKKYPEQVENYEMLVQYYLDNEMIEELCNKISNYRQSWPDSEIILSGADKVERSYQYRETGYYDVKYVEPTLVDIQVLMNSGTEEEMLVQRKMVGQRGRAVFDWGYAQNVMSQDFVSCFVCDQDGNWKKVNAGNYLLACNSNVSFEYIGRLGKNNIATAIIDGKYCFINGEMNVSEKFWEMAGSFHDDLNAVMQNGKWGFVTTANWTEENIYPYVDIVLNSQKYCTLNGRSVVADEKGYYIIETEEFNPVSANVYEEIKAFESNQPTAYRTGNKWGFITTEGEVHIEAMYEDAKPFVNGYAAVKQDGKWGYINSQNQMIVEPQYADAHPILNSGFAYVKNDIGYWDIVIIDKLYYAQ